MAKKLQPLQTAAKNVILFLGDGECARPVHPLSPHNPGALSCRLTQAGPRDSDLTQCVPSGMGVSTVTAAQILKGQMAGKPGPETPLAGYGPVPIPGSVQGKGQVASGWSTPEGWVWA